MSGLAEPVKKHTDAIRILVTAREPISGQPPFHDFGFDLFLELSNRLATEGLLPMLAVHVQTLPLQRELEQLTDWFGQPLQRAFLGRRIRHLPRGRFTKQFSGVDPFPPLGNIDTKRLFRSLH